MTDYEWLDKIHCTDCERPDDFCTGLDDKDKAAITKQLSIEINKAVGEAIYNYSDYLHEHGYIDSDYYIEEPDPREGFLEILKARTPLNKENK